MTDTEDSSNCSDDNSEKRLLRKIMTRNRAKKVVKETAGKSHKNTEEGSRSSSRVPSILSRKPSEVESSGDESGNGSDAFLSKEGDIGLDPASKVNDDSNAIEMVLKGKDNTKVLQDDYCPGQQEHPCY
jgi:hypothetical protein